MPGTGIICFVNTASTSLVVRVWRMGGGQARPKRRVRAAVGPDLAGGARGGGGTGRSVRPAARPLRARDIAASARFICAVCRLTAAGGARSMSRAAAGSGGRRAGGVVVGGGAAVAMAGGPLLLRRRQQRRVGLVVGDVHACGAEGRDHEPAGPPAAALLPPVRGCAPRAARPLRLRLRCDGIRSPSRCCGQGT